PTLDDFETHLSLFFPEVRARGFLELRSVDCQARVFQAVPGAYYSALLYDERSLNAVLELLMPHAPDIQRLLRAASHGLNTDTTLKTLAKQVFTIALDGYHRMADCFHEAETDKAIAAFYDRFTAQQRTPADDIA